ncbi:MAG: hypothetical protein Q9201_005132 [Fulgogasparrea decipioides]
MAPTTTFNTTITFFGLSNLIDNPTVTPTDRYYWLLGICFTTSILIVDLILLAYTAYQCRFFFRPYLHSVGKYDLGLPPMARWFLTKDEVEVLHRYQLGELFVKRGFYGMGVNDVEKGTLDPLVGYPDGETTCGSKERLHSLARGKQQHPTQPMHWSAALFASRNDDPSNTDDTIHEERGEVPCLICLQKNCESKLECGSKLYYKVIRAHHFAENDELAANDDFGWFDEDGED